MKVSQKAIPVCKIHELEKFYLHSEDRSPNPCLPEAGNDTSSYFSIFLRTENPCKNEIDINRSEFYKILLITKGSGILHYGINKYDVKPGSLLFLKPVEVKSWYATTKEQEGFYCIFNEPFFACNKTWLYELNTHPLFQDGKHPMLLLTEDQLSVFYATFSSLYNEFTGMNVYSEDICRLYLHILLLQSRRLAHVDGENKTDSPAALKLTEQFIEVLEREISGTCNNSSFLRSPSDFAKKLCVHPNYLNACIKKVTGKTVHELIRERLLLEAKVMLKYTHLNIAEISYNLGFRETTHFCNFFKQITSLTPLQYRRVKALKVSKQH